MKCKPVVYIVEDDQSLQSALRLMVETVNLEARIYGTVQQFLDEYDATDTNCPECLVTDVRLPGLSGLDLQEILLESEITLPIIVISAHGDVPMAVEVVKKGAVDFLEKPFRHQQLLDSIRQALARWEEISKMVSDRRESADRLACLTPRQRQVLDLMLSGKSNKVIADELDLSIKTVEHHRSLVMRNMKVNSFAELVKVATASGDM